MTISTIVDTMTNTLDSAKMPANVLPPFLLKCLALNKPGLSAYKIAAKIIENNKALGIPTDDCPDGTQNLINAFVYNISKTVVDALHEDCVVHTSIPLQSLLIQVNGGNNGGPMTSIGTNLTDTFAPGNLI
jgi:hypothetical protein